MNLFLDTSVLLAASDSPAGGSRLIVESALLNGWTLMTSPYVVSEVRRNLHKFAASAPGEWQTIRARLQFVTDVLAINRPVVFQTTKDRPVLLTAYEFADALVTLDRRDFLRLLGQRFYHLRLFDPEGFLDWCRERGAVRFPSSLP